MITIIMMPTHTPALKMAPIASQLFNEISNTDKAIMWLNLNFVII